MKLAVEWWTIESHPPTNLTPILPKNLPCFTIVSIADFNTMEEEAVVVCIEFVCFVVSPDMSVQLMMSVIDFRRDMPGLCLVSVFIYAR